MTSGSATCERISQSVPPLPSSHFLDIASSFAKHPAGTIRSYLPSNRHAITIAISEPAAIVNLTAEGPLPIFPLALVALVAAQIVAKKFHPFLYWATIIASTTFGTTMADFADRSLGIGYTGGSSILLFCVLATLGLWYWSLGSISVDTVNTPKVEAFYWTAITFSQTLGTALGDWMADATGLGYEGGAVVFGAALAVVAAAYYWTKVSRVTLFWAAFILSRPLGATVGDFLDKPVKDGGLALSRPIASAVISGFYNWVRAHFTATGWLASEGI